MKRLGFYSRYYFENIDCFEIWRRYVWLEKMRKGWFRKVNFRDAWQGQHPIFSGSRNCILRFSCLVLYSYGRLLDGGSSRWYSILRSSNSPFDFKPLYLTEGGFYVVTVRFRLVQKKILTSTKAGGNITLASGKSELLVLYVRMIHDQNHMSVSHDHN